MTDAYICTVFAMLLSPFSFFVEFYYLWMKDFVCEPVFRV